MSSFINTDIIAVYKCSVSEELFEEVYRLSDDEPPEATNCVIHLEENHLVELINIKSKLERQDVGALLKKERL